MKIFAKRTKKKVDSTGAPAPRTVNKSDPVVEELLKKDPSEWNAKERRMVKRYQKRKTEEGPATTEEADETEKTAEESTDAPKKDVEQETRDDGENDDKGESSDDNDDSSSSSDDDNDSEDEKQDGKDEENEVESVGDSSSSDEEEESSEEKVEQSTIEKDEKPQEKPETPTEDDGKVPKDHEIWSVLDKLNSKQKRTLSRKLDRLGTAVLDEVEEEANKILDQTIPMETPVAVEPKRPAESTSSEQPTKKKRKKQADWSSLTPEERLRREDQRRKQQEAAERRARGEDIKPGHKRPLNSARRRANRRKPKWEKKAPTDRPAIGSYKQEHHSSGFMVRKNRKEHQQEQASW